MNAADRSAFAIVAFRRANYRRAVSVRPFSSAHDADADS